MSGRIDYQGNLVSDPAVRAKLQELADKFGWSILVTDGDRPDSAKYGSPTSLHRSHHAADLHVANLDDKSVFNAMMASSLVATGWEIILHGRYHGPTVTGPHVHLGKYIDVRSLQPSQFKIDGVHHAHEEYVRVYAPV